MPWITLTEAHIKARLSEVELTKIESVGVGQGGEPRLPGIIAQVTAMVRAKVAACHKNTLGPAGTIPGECLHAAATLAKHDIRASLPSTGGDEENKLRATEYREAINFLNQVAKCEIGIVNQEGEVGGADTGCFGGDDKHEF